jgi:serine/threonine protein kinase
MGEVYRARDTRLNREVAIKVSNAEFSDRFAREARSVAALNHPNICTLYDVVISKNAPNYLVMEFVEGEPPKGPLALEEALRIAAQIRDALESAHEKGRDGKELYFIGANRMMMAVDVAPGAKFQAGAPKPLFDSHFPGGLAWYDVSKDGHFLIAA